MPSFPRKKKRKRVERAAKKTWDSGACRIVYNLELVVCKSTFILVHLRAFLNRYFKAAAAAHVLLYKRYIYRNSTAGINDLIGLLSTLKK